MLESDVQLRETIKNEIHLQVLSLAFWISAGIHAFASLFGLVYASMGVFVSQIVKTHARPGQDFPEFVPLIFLLIGLGIFVIFAGSAVLQGFAAARIKARRSRGYCLFVSGLTCLQIPYGTALGVIAFALLGRPSVIAMFNPSPTASTTATDGPRGHG